MSKKCIGCGAELQSEDAGQIGYTPKPEADYCQRCFRIRHYDDVMISMKQGIDSDSVLSRVAELDALILWVVDLFDFEANLLSGINRHLAGKDIVLVGTKRDLLPDTLGNEKLAQFIMRRLKQTGISVKGIVICGDLVKNANTQMNYSIDEVLNCIRLLRHDRDVAVIGMANAGKSTLLNALMNSAQLTTSRHPGTTLDFTELSFEDFVIYDTPGLTRLDSLLTHISDADLKNVIPMKQVKPIVYQLKGSQSLSVGGLVRLDLLDCEAVSCVCYFSDRLKIHRGKQENADKLWVDHINELLVPSISNSFRDFVTVQRDGLNGSIDVVIHGLGWFCIQGRVSQIRVYTDKNVNVTFREEMI